MLLKGLGKSLSRPRRAGVGLGLIGAGAAAHGFHKGANSGGQLSNDFYELTTGDPGIDEYTFGRSAGMGTVLGLGQVGFAGILGGQAAAGGAIGTVAGGATGAAVGAGAFGLMAARSIKNGHNIRGALLAGGAGAAGLMGMAGGASVGYMAGKTAAVAPYMNSTTVSDFNRYRNQMPYVSGDVVFGAYNARRA